MARSASAGSSRIDALVVAVTCMLNCGFHAYRADSVFPPAVSRVQEPRILVMCGYLSCARATFIGQVGEKAERVKLWLTGGRDCSEMTTVYVVFGGMSIFARVLGESTYGPRWRAFASLRLTLFPSTLKMYILMNSLAVVWLVADEFVRKCFPTSNHTVPPVFPWHDTAIWGFLTKHPATALSVERCQVKWISCR